jgi:hypothetical protein
MNDDDRRAHLIARVEARRAELSAFCRQHRPRNRRRANITLVLTSLAAVFAAAPAAGGERFTVAVQQGLHLGSDSEVWQTLCLGVVLVSAAAAVMTNIAKTHDDTEQIGTVQAACAELDGLLTLLEFNEIPTDEAVKLYQQYMAKVPFVESVVPPAHHEPVHHDSGSAPGRDAGGSATQLTRLPPVPHRPQNGIGPRVPPR